MEEPDPINQSNHVNQVKKPEENKSHNTVANQTLLIMIDSQNAEVEKINKTARATKNAKLERASTHANQTAQEKKALLITASLINHNTAANQILQIRTDLQNAEVEKKNKIVNLIKTARLEKASIHANPIPVERTITKTRIANQINLNTLAYLSLLIRIDLLNTTELKRLNAEVEKTKLTAKPERSITKLARVEKTKALAAQEKVTEF